LAPAPALLVSIAAIVDPCTTMVAFLSTPPVPSRIVAA
jgi:hypothetical protein